MDSMRSLNTSLPTSTSSRPQPPEQLLQAFKTAALSVTNLYKTAASDQARARQAGYQDALEDLLVFLDKENLGLGDGEGWKVRQWATARIDGTGMAGSDSDDERGDTENKSGRSVSPLAPRKDVQEPNNQRQESETVASQQVDSTPPPPPPQPQVQPSLPAETNIFNQSTAFTFTAGPQFPQNHKMDAQSENNNSVDSDNAQSDHPSLPTPVRLEVFPRNPRSAHRHQSANRHNARQGTRDLNLGLGLGSGSKRKFQFGDFFDISNMGNGKDGFGGGGKRGRFT